ncbi:amidase [Methylobacterium isbiliense]|jgi:aspartyl-tRNA(Asn)/glutamyl-tRNA(Gln) amidotransferase subunit A|uniref:Acylamidase n=1 Tax=Methylobacterium isbiliense TaxID=315478 RepID=A0ABQ4SK53_9HYPH|nr:amidase [Methylobacterium isbiliense]MDN3624526.1 amidase [Methylobacterium isbiliense]GJE02120.1 Acylamidase [Methylobacterium isbiliense]
MTESPADLSAADLLCAYAEGALSPVEVLDAVIARADAREPALRALYAPDPDGARAAARASEARWRRGEALPLDGVPATVKENIATAGVPMPLGTAARRDAPPAAADAPSAARLREAGAVIFGRTTMPDYGMLSSGLSSFHPLARNPWDLSRTPGGSSAGAGAAAAAGYGPLHLGTDIGGSVRLPAGWCGIVGLKPSNGRVPVDPPYYGRCAGPMTRTVTDAALAMRELSRPDARDGTALPPQAIDWLALDGLDPKGLRLGLMLEAGVGLPLDPAVRDVVEDAARRLAAAGAVIEPVAPILTREMLDGLDTFWRQRAWSEIGALSPERQASVLPYIRAWAETARSLSGAAVFAGMSQMARMRDAALAATRPFDFLIGPVAPVPAFPAELPSPTNDPRRPFEHIGYTVAFNMSEQPAVSVPAGFTPEGLPVGLQIVGHRFDDRGVLRLARLVEKIRPALAPYPVR